MPSYKIHLLGGAVTYLLLAKLASTFHTFSIPEHLLLLAFTLFGSIFPDIDIGSRMRTLFLLSVAIISPLALAAQKSYFFIGLGAASILFLLLIKHRSITHHLWFIVLLPILCTGLILSRSWSHHIIVLSICIFFIAGALSHRLLDFGPRWFFSKK